MIKVFNTIKKILPFFRVGITLTIRRLAYPARDLQVRGEQVMPHLPKHLQFNSCNQLLIMDLMLPGPPATDAASILEMPAVLLERFIPSCPEIFLPSTRARAAVHTSTLTVRLVDVLLLKPLFTRASRLENNNNKINSWVIPSYTTKRQQSLIKSR